MPGRIQSIERAAAILRLMAGGARGLSLAEISRSLDLPKGTVLGILRTLQHVGFVEQDDATGQYQLGGVCCGWAPATSTATSFGPAR